QSRLPGDSRFQLTVVWLHPTRRVDQVSLRADRKGEGSDVDRCRVLRSWWGTGADFRYRREPDRRPARSHDRLAVGHPCGGRGLPQAGSCRHRACVKGRLLRTLRTPPFRDSVMRWCGLAVASVLFLLNGAALAAEFVQTKGTGFTLNGNPLFVTGVNNHYLTSGSEKEVIRVLDDAVALGANVVR